MRIAAVIILLAAGSAAADAQVPRRVWKVETSAPVAQRLDLVHGETIDLQCTFLSYASPLDILGASVTLHARTNGMAEGSSFQAAGTAGANGLATVRLAVSEWLPATCTNAEWTLEVAQTNAVRILRSYGEARISGSSAASTNDPVPAVWMDDIRADIAAAVADRATTQHVAEAVAEIPRDRIITQDGSQWIDATGGVWRVYSADAGWRLTLPQQTEPVIVGMIDWDNEEGYVEYADMGFWGMSITTDGDLYDISYTSGDGNWRSTGVAPVSPIELQPYENGAVGTVTLWYRGPVVTQRVDGVAWQSDVDGKATFDQVMDIHNYWDGTKLNTTNGVARSLSVTGGLHVYDGIYLNDVLFVPGEDGVALTIYTNASGAATSWWQVARGVTNSGTFASGATNITDGVTSGTYSEATRTIDISNLLAGVSMELPDGIVTNGTDDVTLGRVRMNNDLVTAYYGRFLYSVEDGNLSSISRIVDQGNAVFFRGWRDDWTENIIRMILRGDGSVEIPNGNLTVAGTNTAAAISTTGTVSAASIILPHLGTNTTVSLIFTNNTLQAWEIAP